MVEIPEISEKFKMELYRNTGFALCSPFCFMMGNAIMSGNLEPLSHWGLLIAIGLFVMGFMSILHAMVVAMELDVLKSKYARVYR